jgi:large subunit ribosomal protein L18
MSNINPKLEKRQRRQAKVRAKVSGTAKRPRLSIFRSNTSIFAQLIDDDKSITLLSGSTQEADKKGKMKKIEAAMELGKLIAKKAQEKKIDTVVFDRGGNKYHGRVKAVAEGAREGGLKF